MSVRRKPVIARAFDRATHYDDHAVIQRAAAARLADLIGSHSLHGPERVLEIGCGTGFLSRRLVHRFPMAQLILTDISPAMIRRARAMLSGHPIAGFLVMDGERPAVAPGSTDLICANLAFQWFEHLDVAIARLIGLLPPGGHLAFSTLARGTFAEWRKAHQKSGVTPATRDYPSLEELRSLCPPGASIHVEGQTLVERHRDGRAFVRSLKAIGAHTPWQPRHPLPPGVMRSVLRAFEDGGAAVTYEIAHVIISKSPEGL